MIQNNGPAQGDVEGPGGIEADASNIWETIDNPVNGFLELVPKLVVAVVLLAVFVLTAKGVAAFVRRTTPHREPANVGMVLGRLAELGILFIGLLVAVSIVVPTIGEGDLLQLLGVGSVAIGFAFRDILHSFLAGLLILLREPSKIGDQLIFNDFEGTVEHIETRATFPKTYAGRRVVIPDGELSTNAVQVNTAFANRRSGYDLGIGYGDDTRQAARIMREARAGSSVNLRARWWTLAGRAEVMRVQSEVMNTLKERRSEAGVDLPFPTQVVLFHDQAEATDGGRTAQRAGWPAGSNPLSSRKIADVLHRAACPADGRPGAERAA